MRSIPPSRAPINGLFGAVEAVLREPRRVMHPTPAGPATARSSARLLLIAIVSAAVYGLIVGTFSGGTQLWAAPAKIRGGAASSRR